MEVLSELMFNILKNCMKFIMFYSFCLKEQVKNSWKLKKFKNLAANLHNKKDVICIRNLKLALNQGLVLKKMHRSIIFN